MSDEQIRMLYRDAADKMQQLEILCQLTLKSKDKICEILGIENKDKKKSAYGWTEEQIDFLRKNKDVMTNRQIGDIVHKSTKAVYQMRMKLEGNPLTRSNSRWRDDETAFLRKAYMNKVSTKRIGEILGKSTKAVYSKLHELRRKGELYD